MIHSEVLNAVRRCIRDTVHGISSPRGQACSLNARDMQKAIWLDKDQVPVLLGLSIGL